MSSISFSSFTQHLLCVLVPKGSQVISRIISALMPPPPAALLTADHRSGSLTLRKCVQVSRTLCLCLLGLLEAGVCWSCYLCSASGDNGRIDCLLCNFPARNFSPLALAAWCWENLDSEIWIWNLETKAARTKYAVCWGFSLSCALMCLAGAPLYIHWSDLLKCCCCTQHVDLYLPLFSVYCCTPIWAWAERASGLYIYSGQGIRPYRAPLCILNPVGGPSMCGIHWKQSKTIKPNGPKSNQNSASYPNLITIDSLR